MANPLRTRSPVPSTPTTRAARRPSARLNLEIGRGPRRETVGMLADLYPWTKVGGQCPLTPSSATQRPQTAVSRSYENGSRGAQKRRLRTYALHSAFLRSITILLRPNQSPSLMSGFVNLGPWSREIRVVHQVLQRGSTTALQNGQKEGLGVGRSTPYDLAID